MTFQFPLAPVVRRRGCLEEGATRDLAQTTRRLETVSRHLGKIRNEMAARSRTIAHSALLGATGMELGQLARDIEWLERLSIAAAAKAHAQPEKTELAHGNLVVASRFRQMLERLEELLRRDHAHDERREAAERRLADETTAAGHQWRIALAAGEAKGAR
jgi:flagellar export protein FliJ